MFDNQKIENSFLILKLKKYDILRKHLLVCFQLIFESYFIKYLYKYEEQSYKNYYKNIKKGLKTFHVRNKILFYKKLENYIKKLFSKTVFKTIFKTFPK